MNQQLTFLNHLSDFHLVKYEPDSIVLVSKSTKQSYIFQQIPSNSQFHPQISHSSLHRPILFKNGALYLKGASNLKIELESRMRSSKKQYYSEEQILNTFNPIIQCIQFLHEKNIVHGGIRLDSILFLQNGDIRLKDWLTFQNIEQNSNLQTGLSNDMKALGLTIACFVCLEASSQMMNKPLEEIIARIMENYSNTICYALIILLQGMVEKFKDISNILKNDKKWVLDEAIDKIHQQCLDYRQKQKPKKVVNDSKTQKEPKTSEKIGTFASFESTPKKKKNIVSSRREETQNKKVGNEQAKKRKIEKITKIIERSNAFINELMARKNNDKKVKKNDQIIGSENLKKSIMKQAGKLGSPSKRMKITMKKR